MGCSATEEEEEGSVCIDYMSVCTALLFVVVLLTVAISVHTGFFILFLHVYSPFLALVTVSTSCCYTHICRCVCLVLGHTSAVVLALVSVLCSPLLTCLPVAGSYYWASVFNNVFPRCQACQRREAGDLTLL